MYNHKTGRWDRPDNCKGVWDHMKGEEVSPQALREMGYRAGENGTEAHLELSQNEDYDLGYALGKKAFEARKNR